VVHGEEVRTTGRTPEPATIRAIADFLDERGELAPFCTASLPALLPAATDEAAVASGLVSFALPGVPRRRLLWFRPQVVETVRWAGDPRKPVEADRRQGLHPRRSFALWKEEVRRRSRRFSPSELEAADELRRHAMETDLERQVARGKGAVRVRDELLAVVSHDLKNPLGVIQMQAAVLQRAVAAVDDEPARHIRAGAERIQRAVDRMNALVHELLDLARIEAGRFSVQTRPEPVEELAAETLGLLRPLAEAKGITVVEELIGIEGLRVQADRERIFQVFSNLVGNAIEFTPPGGRVALRAERREQEVLFAITDSGPGISSDQLPHLFDRYWQGRKKSREGSGLGLYIAHGIVRAHGGQIWVETADDGGATFALTLPLSSRGKGDATEPPSGRAGSP
jgi:light-regulated signal transduction histidine kinase (bacteriophytochrome)